MYSISLSFMVYLVLLDLGIQVTDIECPEVWAEDLLKACNLGLSASNYLEVVDTLSYKGKILSSTEDDLIECQRFIEVLEEAGSAEEGVDATALNCRSYRLFDRCQMATTPCEFMGARTC